jgi:hypothetical protein
MFGFGKSEEQKAREEAANRVVIEVRSYKQAKDFEHDMQRRV